MNERKTIFSGIQPTGKITIGNYLGALKNWVPLQEEYDCIYCVVDLHSLTVQQDPATLRRNVYDLLALYLACGIDPQKSTVFLQSHVSAHAELTWILNTVTYVGELNRMTQFKDKCAKHADNINMGLMDYPVLMASDILLYQTNLVPVGQDQKQHLELARDVAERFNNRYSPTFAIPDGFIPKQGAKVMSLADPSAKMSKSDENENAYVTMLDAPQDILRKFKRAVTDSEGKICFDPVGQPGVSNLLTIYSAFSGKSVEDCVAELQGLGYGALKERTAEATIAALEPIQKEHHRLLQDKSYLDEVLKTGAEKAERIAQKTLAKVYRKVGLLPRG